MRSLVVLFVTLMFIVPVPALAQVGSEGNGAGADVEQDMGPGPTATLMTEELGFHFYSPVTYMGLGTGGSISLMVPGLASINVPGLPRVPVKTANLEFPAGTTVEDVKVTHDIPTTFVVQGEIDLAPPYIAIGQSGNTGTIPIDNYYDGERFPADWYTYEVHRGLNDEDEPTIFVNMFIYPLSTEGVSGGYRISYISSIDIDVEYTPPVPLDGASSRDDGRSETYDLLIVTAGGFTDEFEKLANHKKQTGLDTKVVSLAEIYDGDHFATQGRDDQEKIKYFIKDAVEQWGVTYVLMGGDVDKVPTRHTEVFDDYDDDGSWGQDGKWVPTDMYFADIYDGNNDFDDWDGNDNQVYGQWTGGTSGFSLDDPDFYLDVYIGRLPASSSSELNIMINKIINYENNTDWSWFFNAGLAGLDTFTTDPWGIPESEYGLDKIGEVLQPAGYNLIKLYETQGTLSGNAIVNTVTNGVSIMSLSGHGAPDAWGSETQLYFWNSLIAGMNNGIRLPVGSQSACSTGAFDNEDPVHYPGWNRPESMAEVFVLKSGGGYIANMGSSRVAYGSYGTSWTDYNAGYLNKKFYTALVDGHGTPGKMISKARNDNMGQHGSSIISDYKHMMSFNIIGDPSAALGGIGILIDGDDTTPEIAPGKKTVFEYNVKNVGIWDTPVSMEAVVEDADWTAKFDIDSFDLVKGEEQIVKMTVTVPATAVAGTTGKFKVKAISDFNDRSALVMAGVKVSQVFSMGFWADQTNKTALPGVDVVFNLTVKNKGNGPDGASLSLADIPQGWGVQLETNHLDMGPFEDSKTKVTLSLPAQVLSGSYWFNVSAVLDGASITIVLDLRVDVEPSHDIDMVCVVCDASVDPGADAELLVKVSNLGNIEEHVTLTATVPDGWDLIIPQTVQTIGPYSSTEASIDVTPENKALAGTYDVKVFATIDEETVEVALEVTVNRLHGIELVVDIDTLMVEGGKDAVFAAEVMNTGNGPEQVEVDCIDAPPGWVAQGEVRSFNVQAYSTYRLKFIVSTDFASPAGQYTVDMRTMGQDPPNVKDEATLNIGIAERIDGLASLKSISEKVYPGSSVSNYVIFENLGNVYEEVTIEQPSQTGELTVVPMAGSVTVTPGTSAEIGFHVIVPSGYLAGTHSYSLTVNRDKGKPIELGGVVEVEHVFGFDLEAEDGSQDVARGDKIIRKVTVVNTGNDDDNFTVRILGDTGHWASPTEEMFQLEPGKSRTIYITIAPPANAAPEYHEVLVDVTSECGSTKEEAIGYHITSPDHQVSVGTTVGSVFPWIIVIIVVMFAIGRTISELKRRR